MSATPVAATAPTAGTIGLSTTRYVAASMAELILSNTEADRQVIYRLAGTMDRMSVYGTGGSGTAATVTLRKGGVDTALIVSMTAGTTGLFQDLTHSVAIAAGDLLSYKIVGASGSVTTVNMIEARFSATADTASMLVAATTAKTLSSGLTRYAALGGLLDVNTTEASVAITSRVDGTLTKGQVYLSSNGASNAATVTFRKNAASPANGIVISITASTTGRFEDTSRTIAVAAGDTLDVMLSTGNANADYELLGCAFVTTASIAQLTASRPGGTSSVVASTTNFMPVAGLTSSTIATEAKSQIEVPTATVARYAGIEVSANTRTATTVTLRKGGVDTTITFSITASTTGWFEDTTHTVSLAQGDLIAFKMVTGTGTNLLTWTATTLALLNPKSIAVGQATETDSASAITRKKARAVGQASEADSATVITRKKARTLGQVTETDSATAVARSKRKTLGQSTETDTAQALARSKTKAIGAASEVDTAQPIGRSKAFSIGQPSEIDSAQPVTPSKTLALGAAVETDSAGAVSGSKTTGIGQAEETDAAQPVTPSKAAELGQAVEQDEAQPLASSKTKTLGQAIESAVAQAITAVRSLLLGQPVETDTAQPISSATRIPVNQATETDAAQPIGRLKARAVGQAAETDTAQPVRRVKFQVVGQSAEVDLAQALTILRSRRLGQAIETDTAFGITAEGGTTPAPTPPRGGFGAHPTIRPPEHHVGRAHLHILAVLRASGMPLDEAHATAAILAHTAGAPIGRTVTTTTADGRVSVQNETLRQLRDDDELIELGLL